MSLKYVFESDAAQLRKDPLADGEDIYEGEFVTRNSDGELARFDPANDALPSGIVVHHVGRLSDALNLHDEDYSTYEELYHFEAANDDSVYYLPLEAGQSIMPPTIEDTDLTEPSVGDGTTVGIVNIGSSGKTRVVESGYSDGGTTYSEGGAGDFVALGTIYQEPQYKRLEDNYNQRIPVYLDTETFQP